MDSNGAEIATIAKTFPAATEQPAGAVPARVVAIDPAAPGELRLLVLAAAVAVEAALGHICGRPGRSGIVRA